MVSRVQGDTEEWTIQRSTNNFLEVMEMLCILMIIWFYKCTTVKIHQIVHFKWVTFIIYKLFLHNIDASKTKTTAITNDHNGLDEQARVYLLPVFD